MKIPVDERGSENPFLPCFRTRDRSAILGCPLNSVCHVWSRLLAPQYLHGKRPNRAVLPKDRSNEPTTANNKGRYLTIAWIRRTEFVAHAS